MGFATKINGLDVRDYIFSSSKYRAASSTRSEAIKAAKYCGFTYPEYLALPGTPRWADGEMSKAEVLAAYQMQMLYEAALNDMQSVEMNRKRRR